MQRQQISLFTAATKAVHGGVFPDIGSVAPIAAELDVVAVFSVPALEHEHQLMARTIERAHAAVRLNPDADILELGIGGSTGPEHLMGVRPVDANIVHGAVDTETCR